MAKTFILTDQCGDTFSLIRKYHLVWLLVVRPCGLIAVDSTNTEQEEAQLEKLA